MALLRVRGEAARATNIELFVDLVYVFAVTQLSHHLLGRPTWSGAAQTALLLMMVWHVWIYTVWMTNWLDPARLPVRLCLVALMLASLLMSSALPQAFGTGGVLIGWSYAVMQVGRSAFAVLALQGADRLQRNFERALCWCVASGVLAVAGGFAHDGERFALWAAAVAVDLVGGAVGFWTPGLGRSRTEDWTIEGNHFAERCQAFVLIALGESVVVIGATFSDIEHVDAVSVYALVLAFVGAVAVWWVLLDRRAEDDAAGVAGWDAPGRLGRSAYHDIHPFMVGGIIVTAAADERVLAHPTGPVDAATAWMLLGGTALFVAGHAVFKATVWGIVPWTRIAAVGLLAALGLVAPYVSGLV
ncbi:MAG: low temperature requirement protein A, partial [Actinomycetes bacterium]